MSSASPTRLRIFVTHPVQYHVPLWRALAQTPGLDVKVFYFSDVSVRGGRDKGFGLNITWDVDLLGGYSHEFLQRDGQLDDPNSMKIADAERLLRKEQADWVLLGGYTQAFERQLVRSARKTGARVVVRGEFTELSEFPRPWAKQLARTLYLRWFYAQVDRFCYIGDEAFRHLKKYGVRDDQLSFSPYSVDDSLLERQQQQFGRQDSRRSMGLDDDTFVFLISGKLIERKNVFAVLDALRRIPEVEKVALIALGDGPLKAAFTEAARASLGERFIFPGFVNQSQLGRFFLAADAHVMTSQHETWGLVVNEAMHYGLPSIVSSRVGCAPDLVTDGVTGYVYPAGDIATLASYMQLMVSRPEHAKSMGNASKSRINRYRIVQSARGVLHALSVSPVAPTFYSARQGEAVTRPSTQ